MKGIIFHALQRNPVLDIFVEEDSLVGSQRNSKRHMIHLTELRSVCTARGCPRSLSTYPSAGGLGLMSDSGSLSVLVRNKTSYKVQFHLLWLEGCFEVPFRAQKIRPL